MKNIDKILKNGCADFGKEGKVTDYEIYKFVMKHSSFWDRLNPKKMVEMTITSQLMLYPEYLSQPKKKNWKFFKDFL